MAAGMLRPCRRKRGREGIGDVMGDGEGAQDMQTISEVLSTQKETSQRSW